MSEPKSLSELAMQKRRRAREERQRAERYYPVIGEAYAGPLEREAAALMALPAAPEVGPGGEVINTQPTPEGHALALDERRDFARWVARDTLSKGATRVAEDASERRTDLLLQASFNALPLAVDAAESIGAANSLEKMLAHQMAVAHEASLRLMNRALSYDVGGRAMREGDSVEACRLTNAAARLMTVFQGGLLTLQRLRTGGSQTVTVQHVTVESGGKAVIGTVAAGGRKIE